MKILALLGILAIGASAQAADARITLASSGQTQYAIVLPDEPANAETTAAQQLRKYLGKATQADFEIVKESAYGSQKLAILVGKTVRTGKYLSNFDFDALGRDGIVIKTKGKDIIITGNTPGGTLNAAVTFLEDNIGVRWWTATEEDVPQYVTLELDSLDHVFVPKLQIRHNWSMELQGAQPHVGPKVSKDASDLFCVHLKNNGKAGLPDKYGGSNTIFGAHTVPLRFLKESDYFADHPEWYGLVEGKRIAHQVCWMNEEMRGQLIKNVLQFLRDNPSVTVVSVSQNDGGSPCECPECMAVVEREGTQMGPILEGVNAVADAVAREFPDVLVETLSYYYSRKCPKHMRARDNVLVRICTYEQTINKPLTESKFNEDNRDNVLEWGGHAKNLFVWNYVTDFSHYMYPQPNFFALAPNLRFFVEHNVKGVFMQGDVHCQTGDFQNLRAWFVSHILWDPYQDDVKLLREFCDGYYGKAGGYVYNWIETMCKAGYDYPKFIGIYNSNLSFLTLDVMNKGHELWNAAQDAVKNDPIKSDRVRKARLSFDLAAIINRDKLKAEAKAAGKTYLDTSDETQAVEDLLEAVKYYGTTHFSEVRGELATFEAELRSRFAKPKESEMSKLDRVEMFGYQLPQGVSHRELVDDSAATNGKAARTVGDHIKWAIQFNMGKELYGKWRFKAYVRLDATNTDGNGLQIGIYDPVTAIETLPPRVIPAAKCGITEYAELDLGAFDLRPGMYAWFAPINDPANVQAVYVDRVLFERAH